MHSGAFYLSSLVVHTLGFISVGFNHDVVFFMKFQSTLSTNFNQLYQQISINFIYYNKRRRSKTRLIPFGEDMRNHFCSWIVLIITYYI